MGVFSSIWPRKWGAKVGKVVESTSATVVTKRIAGNRLVIFVHGLSGSPEGTWSNMVMALSSDPDFVDISFDCYGYPSVIINTFFGKRMANVQQIASGLSTYLEVNHEDKAEVLIVGHSLGGIIARYLILEEIKKQKPSKVKGLILFATPSTGSELANMGSYISFSQRHLKQLCKNSDILNAINNDWVTLKAEEKVIAQFVVGGGDKVVTPDSAAPYYGASNVRTLIEFGHREIVKPENCDDIRYKTLKSFLSQFFSKVDCDDFMVM